MGQEFLKDITPPAHKRSIRDIPIPVSRKGVDTGHDINLKKLKVNQPTNASVQKTARPVSGTAGVDEQYYKDFLAHQTPKKRSSIAGPLFGIVFVFALIVGGLHVFASATLTLHVKDAFITLNNTIDIVELSKVETETQLVYREIPFSKEVSTTIEATGEEYVSKKSAGVLTVYNEYSTKPQNLLKNTRFESASGKIYRIDKSVNVPGYKTVDGKRVPGTLDVVVYADATGIEYDTTDKEYTVPGFKGQDQYTLVYARLKNPIDGGFEGTRKIVSADALATATETLTAELKSSLVTEVTKQLPTNLIPIYNDASFDISPLNKKDGDDGKVHLSLAGKLTIKVVDKNKLSEKLAEVSIPDYVVGSDVSVEDFTKLSISMSENSISVSGDAHIVWQIDENEVKKMAAGTPKNQVQSTFQNLAGVEKIETKFTPMWKSAFPDKVERINVVKVISDN